MEPNRHWEFAWFELSETACRSFFGENQLRFSERVFKTENDSRFVVFESERITLWCGDFFELPLEVLQNVDAIYDRAALIALPEQTRARYAAYLCKLANRYPNKLRNLLVTLEYDQLRIDGPPFSVSNSEVRKLFERDFRIDEEEVFNPDTLSENPKFAAIIGIEKIYVLSAR